MSSVSPRPRGADSSRRALLGSNLLDASGRNLSDIAVDILAVAVLGASAAQIGLLNALGSAAFLILGIPIGVLIDRHPTARLLVGSGLVRAVLLFTAAAAAWAGSLTFLHLVIVTGFVGIGTVFTETAQTALVPRITATDSMGSLVARLQSADSAAGLIVPGIAGIIIAIISPASVLGIGAGVMACGALLAAFVRLKAVETEDHADREETLERAGLAPFFAEAAEGWRILKSRTELWRLTFSSMVINLSLALFSAIEAILILRTLDLGAPALGFAASASAAGALLGSLAASGLLSRYGTRRILIAGSCLLPFAATVTGASLVDRDRALIWILAGSFLWGAAIVAYNIAKASRTAELAPVEALGRISALGRTLSMGVVPAGSIAGGLAAGWVGMAPILGFWIVLTAAGTCIVLTAKSAG